MAKRVIARVRGVNVENPNGRLHADREDSAGDSGSVPGGDLRSSDAAGQGQRPSDSPAGGAGKGLRPRTRGKLDDKPVLPPDLEQYAKVEGAGFYANPYDPGAEEKYPFLWQLLTFTEYTDHVKAILPTLKITRENGCYAICIQDHERSRQAVALSNTLEGLLPALEAAVRSPLAWRGYKSPLNR